ncbi:MAG TPA: hypothetical protein PK624_13505 [Spirochaetota bacterium]|nr:hypothetical protein [Spirochaetota bacterium]HOR45804.1 hypothetical protein [Spirochaetota bacterium]HPK57623.1 hypothetical protein [Spirochaetota bacterium]
MNSDFNILTNVGIGAGMKIDAERNLIKLEGEILRELYEYGDGGAYSIKATTETTLERNGEVLPYDQFKNPLLKKYLNSVNNNTISWNTANNKDNDINWTTGDNILVGAMTLGASWGYASATATGTVIKTGLKSVALDATFGAGVNMMTYGVTTGLSGNDFKLKDFAISGITGGVTGAALSPFTGESAYGILLSNATRLTIPATVGFSTDLLSQYVSSGYDYNKLNLVQAGWTGFNYGLASFVGGMTNGSNVAKSLTGNSFRLVPSVVGGGALGSFDDLQIGNVYKSIIETSDWKMKNGKIKLD